MGCVTSKHLKQQAIHDGWTSPPADRTITRPKTSRSGFSVRSTPPRPQTPTSSYSIECYHHHHHFVSLTSTSYGSMKVESPKRAEAKLVHDKGAAATLNDMYGTLQSLEMMHENPSRSHNGKQLATVIPQAPPAPIMPFSNLNSNNYRSSPAAEPAHTTPSGDVNIMNSIFVPSGPGSPNLSFGSVDQLSMSSAELGLPETINVKEMMMGLEEAAPISQASSPSKHLRSSNTSTPRTKASQQHSKRLKRKADGFLTTMQTCTSKKGVAGTTHSEWTKEEKGIGKENTSPLRSQHVKKAPIRMASYAGNPVDITPFSQISKSPFKATAPRWDASNLTNASCMSQQSTLRRTGTIQTSSKENVAAKKAAFEPKSSFSGSQNDKSSPGVSSTSIASTKSVHYGPSNGKVRLTLHTQQHGNESANIARTPSPLPVRPMSRRSAIGGGFTSSEVTSPTFEPELVASYEKALSDVSRVDWNPTHVDSPNGCYFSSADTGMMNVSRPWRWSSMPMPKAGLDRRLYNPLESFQDKCPPGGENAVVLYTTTLRGIRKTFEDCNTAREILQTFALKIDERDVSMHLEFLNELRELMGRVVSVPRMFIKGRYIGGIEEVVKLHEEGTLSDLVEGLPKQLDGGSCDGCGGVRFVPCLECRGSCKLRSKEDDRVMRCPDCNENGLIQCPICT